MSIKQRAKSVEEIYQEIEMKLLEEIARVLKEGTPIDEITDVVNWRVEKLRLLGEINTRHKLILAEYADKTLEEITKFIEEVGYKQVKEDERQLDPFIQLGIKDYIPPDNIISNVLGTLEQSTLTKVNIINANVLNNAGQKYVDIVAQATTEAIIGNKTMYQAVTEAVRALANKGIPALRTVDGRELSLDGYIPTVIRSTQKQAAQAMQEGMYDEYDIDLVEISSHLDSRPSHAPFQGKIYSRSGISDKYPPLETTGYGKIDGLITGINCRHLMYPYVEGVSVKRYDPYSKEETDKAYRESQLQRQIEREIRQAKREKKMLEEVGANHEDIKKVNDKIRQRQAKMRAFINKTGRTRRRAREQVKS